MRTSALAAAAWAACDCLIGIAHAQPAPCDLIGVWKLTYFASENMNTNIWRQPLGEALMATSRSRPSDLSPSSQPDSRKHRTLMKIECGFQTSLAYSGPYWIETNRLTVRVQVAWDETWTGTNQVHAISCEEDKLFLNTVAGCLNLPARHTGHDRGLCWSLCVSSR